MYGTDDRGGVLVMAIVRRRALHDMDGDRVGVLTVETANKPGDYVARLDGVTVATLRAVKREGRTGYDVRTLSGLSFCRHDGIDGAIAGLVSIGRDGGLGVKP
ncbi:TPA: hypothetical protein ACGCAJ_004723 [Serratia marcescens]